MSRQVQIRQIFNIWHKHTTHSLALTEIKNHLEDKFKTQLQQKSIVRLKSILARIKKSWEKCYRKKSVFENKNFFWLNSFFDVEEVDEEVEEVEEEEVEEEEDIYIVISLCEYLFFII